MPDPDRLSAVAGKRGALTGAAVTDEVLDSSPTLLRRGRDGATIGLQQIFTPPQAAELIAAVNGATNSTLDLTAGSGALLAPVAERARFGIEIDPDHAQAADYEVLQGDVQLAGPMLQLLGARWPRIACNPPFGLQWESARGPENSTIGAWRMAIALLQQSGAGAFIAGRDRFLADVLTRPDAAGVYALIECPDLFDGVELPCVIAFFVHPDNADPAGVRADGPVRLFSRRDELALLADPLLAERDRVARFVTGADGGECWHRDQLVRQFTLVRGELRRRRERAAGARQRHDVALAGGRVSVRPSAYTRVALEQRGVLRQIERLHRQPPSYFALNSREWKQLQALEREQLLALAPDVADTVAQAIRAAELALCPLYPLAPQMRLGYLDDLDQIRCIRSDPARGFLAGETYPLQTRSQIETTYVERPREVRGGRVELCRYDREAKVLRIDIAEEVFTEAAADIGYLLDHFEIPDPGCMQTRFPHEVAQARAVLQALAEQHGFSFMTAPDEGAWQLQDLALLLTKGYGELCWEQGGGKSLGGLSLILGQFERGAQRAGLIVAPQDLIPQWQEQAQKFYGRELIHITTPAQARAVARHLRAGGEGIYITHYEALSLVGRIDDPLPETRLHVPVARRRELAPTSADFCPACRAGHYDGWQERSPHVCQACGYVHKRRKVKTAAHYLAGAFRDGVIVVDEGTLAKGDQSLRSKALRGLRARHRYLMTGTPISNYVNDSYWLLWWSRGNAALTFPYSYDGGRGKYENDFCVIEHREVLGRREGRKVLPEITNVSRFWRLLASCMIRRRKHQMGELPPRTIRTIAAPMGASQLARYRFWLARANFADYFRHAHPDTPFSDETIERHAAGLGQLSKLEYATTLPEADPDLDWHGLAGLPAATNWTPKNLKVLQVALDHVARGEKVLIGSDLIDTGRWLAERLQEKGVNAAHIVEQRAGRAATMSPRRRAKAIQEFKHGDTQVLCCGIPSIRLGHSLETASCVIVNGLVWSYEMFDQFIARAWRLSSVGPVTVYIALTLGSLDPRRWALLVAKAKAADLALDGHLVDEPEQPISQQEILRELQRQGVRPTGDEIAEADIAAAWEATPGLLAAAAGALDRPLATPETAPRLTGRPWHELRHDGPVEQLTFFTS